MEEIPSSTILDGEIVGIQFALASQKEICTASISDCSISHASQLSNPFLGLPLEFGKCESCGTAEPGKCEGHFGYIELPIPIYHPSHVSELKRMLSLLCLNCLKLRNTKLQVKNNGIAQRLLSSCCEYAQVSIRETKTTEGASYLQLKLPSNSRQPDGFWSFLDRYGFRYGDGNIRTLLPCEVKAILKKIPAETRKKLVGKGYFPQDGYILEFLPVPPNCLSVPDVSDGVSIMSSDLSTSVLKKVLKQVEIIRSSRSGTPNFQSQEVEANDLQLSVDQYLQVRGTAKAARDADGRYGVKKESANSSTKAWLEKMRTLFIRKGSGFSSRSVITGDAYKRVNEIGIPFEIAQRITFEEKVNMHNMNYLQKLVDDKLCLTYKDGSSTYSLREGSKGHTFLRPGQVVHRRIMDGDTVFINRPPTTHKHSLQALSVYVHDDHTVKINPLICGPLSADFDGDCIHLFYPQSLAAKAEVVELFSVEKQLLSSHSGNLNLQMATDSLLSLKVLFKKYLLDKATAQQLAMFVSSPLPQPGLLKAHCSGPRWTALQMLQTAFPACFDCRGDKYLISKSELLKIDFNRDIIHSLVNDIVTSVFFEKGPEEVLKFFDSLQPLLMENLFVEGFSVGLEDFSMSKASLKNLQMDIQDISPLLYVSRSTKNELVELQASKDIRYVKAPVSNFILKSSKLGDLIDSKSESAVSKVVQQTGFLGLQLLDKGRFYSTTLVEDFASHFQSKYPKNNYYPSAEYGLIKGCFFHGLDPYEEMVHSVSTREVIVRSSRGLSEPGTLFKNLMAILRDVVICYDGTVRNVCSNSIVQFEYGMDEGSKSQNLFPAGEPVGVLAATAMSNPAYKAVLDSTPSSNSSWDLMKEILLCRVNFKNDLTDRRVILYLNDCGCGGKSCRKDAAYMVKNQLKRVSLKDTAEKFLIEYNQHRAVSGSSETDAGLVGHVHLNKMLLEDLDISMDEILQRCQEAINSFCKKKKVKREIKMILQSVKKTVLSVSECCSFQQSSSDECSNMPCLMFLLQDTGDIFLERISFILANVIYPVLLETTIKGDSRIFSASVIWISPDTTTWIRNPRKTQKGEWALDIVLEKSVIKGNGDTWRIVLDSCLPVLHLIDTRRSMPYAIKQVQELLGVSCAFEQAVQRLSTSVTMVSKGIRKEHLILLANSMTCSGNLVGFNSGGYKALTRSSNVQVPFTEATLFTPRKCFEKAAEKCHVDNLSSVVASCAWGKRVAVGTGSRFDVLLDTKEMELNQKDGLDVYGFLHMMRSSTGVEESNAGCLGAEVDDLMPEDEMADGSLSPEQNSCFDKPVFEDSADFQNCLDNQPEDNWGKSTLNNGSSGGGDWGADKFHSAGTNTAESDAWGGWNKDKGEAQDVPTTTTHDGWGSEPAWGSKKVSDQDTWGGKVREDESCKEDTAWGINKVCDAASSWGIKAREDESCKDGSAWGGKKVDDATSSWGRKTREDGSCNDGAAWGSKKAGDATSLWGRKARENESSNDGAAWGSKKAGDATSSWESRATEDESCKDGAAWGSKRAGDATSSWGIKAREDESGKDAAWGSQKVGGATTSWGSKARESLCKDGANWGSKPDNGWQTPLDQERSSSDWNNKGTQGTTSQPMSGWDLPDAKGSTESSWGQNKTEAADGRGSAKESLPEGLALPEDKGNNDSSWGSKPDNGWQTPLDQERSSSDWNNKGTQGTTSQPMSGWDLPDAKGNTESSWGQNKTEAADGWGPVKKNRPEGWSLADDKGNNDSSWGQHKSEATDGWGPVKKNRPEGSRGWGPNNGEWKGKKNRPARSPGVANEDSTMGAMQTVTKQRLDMFTSEEQDILSDVEPIMQSIRKILHNPGYTFEDPLPAEEQSFILENVFNYHPDKEVKMGAGIDHFMVNKHTTFQDTRCLYVVTKDGKKEDFSYIKCLTHYIIGKFPDLAEEFNGKYFRKPKSAGGNQQQQNLAPIPEENK